MEEILNLKSKVNLKCSLCEKCCEYRGDIKITPINILEISKFLNVPINEFIEKFTEEVQGEEPEVVIKGIGEKKECIFNDRQSFKCTINKVKPMQCVVFPLVPIDINKDLFYDSKACVRNTRKKVTVNKWINGNHNIYKKHKEIYLKWIDLMFLIQPYWKLFSIEKKEKIKKVLYMDYDIKKNLKKQVIKNIERAKKIINE